jgi:N-methylhydantoinase A
LNSLELAARGYDLSLAKFLGTVEVLIHGSTVATNAIATRKGVATGMITTKNFRDVYELRRGIRLGSINDLFVPPYEPLVPRYRRLGVEERTLHTGQVLTSLNEEDVREAMKSLVREGVESVAICFLHSYANPANERRALEICGELYDKVHAVASHEALPVWREFERFSATVLSAYVGPIVQSYLRSLEQRLRDAGFKGGLFMVAASSLTQSVEYCLRRAVHMIGSGPAAAPTAAVFFGRQSGKLNLISYDVGGTTSDICVIWNGRIPTTTEKWIGDERLALKTIDVDSFGAGGGSIAKLDRLGVLKVGPESAGAKPGPASYGQGGEEPTLTDAALILGYIPHDYFLGGQVPLYEDLARKAVGKLAQQMGLSVEETAAAIVTTANAVMAQHVTTLTTKRGYDTRDFVLVAGGGAGPPNCLWLAEELGITTVVVPRLAALYSAFGMLNMDMGWEYSRSFLASTDKVDLERLNTLYAEMESEGIESLRRLRVPTENVSLTRTADMRYEGQYHEIEVGLPGGKLTQREIADAAGAFHRRHADLHAFALPEREAEFLTFHLRVSKAQPAINLLGVGTAGEDPRAALKRHRRCWFDGKWVDTPVYEGGSLKGGNVIAGPAIIEEPTTAVVIRKGYRCTADQFGYFVVTRLAESAKE